METLGGFLRGLRQARGLTLGQLSLQSGVAKATLSRWEAGATFPRIPEMERTLDALHASPAHRARSLTLFHVPRTIHAERRANPNAFAPVHLSLGDALFGLRQRVGKTQADIARHVGVSRGMYSHWENDDAQPDTPQLHALGFALGANEAEIVALAGRALFHTPIQKSRDALLYQVQITMAWDDGMSEGLYRLLMLSALANMGYLVRKNQAHVGDVALVVSAVGSGADYWGYEDESMVYYRRALSLAAAAPPSEPLHFHLIKILTDADAMAFKSKAAHVAHALGWLPRFHTPEGKAFFLMRIAQILAEVDPDEALRMGDTYCALVSHNPDEYGCRLHDRANLLRQCGRFAESVRAFAGLTPPDVFRAGLYKMDTARALADMGAWNESRACLADGKQIFNAAGLPLSFYDDIASVVEPLLPQ